MHGLKVNLSFAYLSFVSQNYEMTVFFFWQNSEQGSLGLVIVKELNSHQNDAQKMKIILDSEQTLTTYSLSHLHFVSIIISMPYKTAINIFIIIISNQIWGIKMFYPSLQWSLSVKR